MTNKVDPWELLHEVREEWTRIHSFYADGVALDAKLLSRVDAALAARDAGMNCGKGCPDCGHPYGGLDYCQGDGHDNK